MQAEEQAILIVIKTITTMNTIPHLSLQHNPTMVFSHNRSLPARQDWMLQGLEQQVKDLDFTPGEDVVVITVGSYGTEQRYIIELVMPDYNVVCMQMITRNGVPKLKPHRVALSTFLRTYYSKCTKIEVHQFR